MFYLSLIEHKLRLPPHLLSLALEEAIKKELENIFLDKVITKLGLCVSIYDIRKIDGGFISSGDGASTYTVRFESIFAHSFFLFLFLFLSLSVLCRFFFFYPF
uniref:DNA-directed RNA polymerase subunit n=1 Tax=Rhizophora mucronata TaxID=61149 RepID=A0A2P2L9C1_RHIMU